MGAAATTDKIQETFTGGDFEACRAAERWCKERGISVGTMQRNDPRGLMYGDVIIEKWRNIQDHTDKLHGTMNGDMRSGPVTVSICAPPFPSDTLRSGKTYDFPEAPPQQSDAAAERHGYTPKDVARLVNAARNTFNRLAPFHVRAQDQLRAALAPFTNPPTSHPPRSARGAADLAVTE